MKRLEIVDIEAPRNMDICDINPSYVSMISRDNNEIPDGIPWMVNVSNVLSANVPKGSEVVKTSDRDFIRKVVETTCKESGVVGSIPATFGVAFLYYFIARQAACLEKGILSDKIMDTIPDEEMLLMRMVDCGDSEVGAVLQVGRDDWISYESWIDLEISELWRHTFECLDTKSGREKFSE